MTKNIAIYKKNRHLQHWIIGLAENLPIFFKNKFSDIPFDLKQDWNRMYTEVARLG